METSYALSAREIDTKTSHPASALLLQHDLRKALNRFSLESKTEWLADHFIRNTPFTEDAFLGHGAYKEAYALDDYFVIKLCSQRNDTAAERTLLEIAEDEGLDGVFIPTTFAHLHGFYVDTPYLTRWALEESNSPWEYDDEKSTWVPNTEWEGIFATDVEIQPRIDYTAEDYGEWAYVSEYNGGAYLLDPQTHRPVDLEILEELNITSLRWLEDFLKYYDLDKLERLAAFCDQYIITDLHPRNIGWIGRHPVIIDWQSPSEKWLSKRKKSYLR